MVSILKRKTTMKKTILAAISLAAIIFFMMGFEKVDSTSLPKGEKTAYSQKEKKSAVDNGIGPIKEVKLGPIDQSMVDNGNAIFYSKCYLCHDVDQTKLAPPLRGVAKKLSPAFIMNYLLNTAEMQKKDPIIKALLKEYSNVPKMPDQQLTKEQAREVLEFLRTIE